MTWIKLDDSFADHPKVAGLSDRAFRVHITGLLYCGKYLTDGVIPRSVANKFCINNASNLIKKLVESGLWKPVEGGFEINDYLKYQTSKAQAEMEKETNRLRAQKARKARAEALRNGVTAPERSSTEAHTPTPTPTPTIKDKEVQIVRTAFEQFWNVYPRRDGKKKALEAMGKALKKASIEIILEGVNRYITFLQTTTQQVAMPATWLNGERWNDEVIPPTNLSGSKSNLEPKRKDHHQAPMPGAYGEFMCGLCQQSWPCTKSQENPF